MQYMLTTVLGISSMPFRAAAEVRDNTTTSTFLSGKAKGTPLVCWLAYAVGGYRQWQPRFIKIYQEEEA